MAHCLLDQLPMIVLYNLFTYFLPQEIFFSLLDVSSHLNYIIRSYSNFQLNFKSIHRSHFDLICQHISPDQVKLLILSDDKDKPGQSQLFLSHFQIDQFINLQSLQLIQPEQKSLEIILIHLNKLKYLRALSLKSKASVTLSLPLINLRYLQLLQCTLDDLQNICSTTPKLKTLYVIVNHQSSNFDFQCQLNYLTRLVLHIDSYSISLDEIQKFLIKFPILKHLSLYAKIHSDLANGHEWEVLAKHLITLKFAFDIDLDYIEATLDTFRSLFWLEEKCWFVAYDNQYLYTVPRFKYQHVNELFRPPPYTTVLKNSIFYDHVDRLTLKYRLIQTCHRINNITTLDFGCKYISMEVLSAIVKLNGVKNLTLSSAMNKLEMEYLFNRMPCLQHLSIDTLMLHRTLEDFKSFGGTIWDFIEKVKDQQFKQIRVLTISDYHIIKDSYTIDRLCQIFPYIERLHVSIERIDNIIQFIDSLKYLSSVSFNLKFSSNNELIINRMKESILSTFTYRFDDTCLHIWIKEEKEIMSENKQIKYWEYFCNRVNYNLSQQPILSLIVPYIYIITLVNIMACIRDSVYGYDLLKIMTRLPSHPLITLYDLTDFCLEFIQKFDRIIDYVYGYIFIGIFIIILYICFGTWVRRYDNKINDNSLRLLFDNPVGSHLMSLECLYRLITEHDNYLNYEWTVVVVIICMADIFICGIQLFVISLIL